MVDGNTLLFATVGDPVAQIRSPQVMGAVFEKLGVNAVWVPMHVDQAGLLAVLCKGCAPFATSALSRSPFPISKRWFPCLIGCRLRRRPLAV